MMTVTSSTPPQDKGNTTKDSETQEKRENERAQEEAAEERQETRGYQ